MVYDDLTQSNVPRDPKYPQVVSMRAEEGLAPKELRLVQKLAGSAFDDLDQIDQLRATGFVALMRAFPDDDPGTLWEVADDVRVKPDVGGVADIPKDDASTV